MSTSTPQPVQTPTMPGQPFRLDVPLHHLRQSPPDHPTLARTEHAPQTSLALLSSVFPQHPALMHHSMALISPRTIPSSRPASDTGPRPRL